MIDQGDRNLAVQISKQFMNNIRTELVEIIIDLEITFLRLQKIDRNLLKDVIMKETYKKVINYTDGTITRLVDNQGLIESLITRINEYDLN
jgi:citrate lyase gamma subunit